MVFVAASAPPAAAAAATTPNTYATYAAYAVLINATAAAAAAVRWVTVMMILTMTYKDTSEGEVTGKRMKTNHWARHTLQMNKNWWEIIDEWSSSKSNKNNGRRRRWEPGIGHPNHLSPMMINDNATKKESKISIQFLIYSTKNLTVIASVGSLSRGNATYQPTGLIKEVNADVLK